MTATLSSCAQCEQLIDQYEPLLVQLLLQALDPDFVCVVRSPVSCNFCTGCKVAAPLVLKVMPRRTLFISCLGY